MDYRTEVTSHVYDIPRRLKELDPDLRVYWNPQSNLFEVHDMASYQTLVFQTEYLDQRTIREMRQLMQCTTRDIERDLEIAEYRRKKDWEKRCELIAEGLAEDLKYLGRDLVSIPYDG